MAVVCQIGAENYSLTHKSIDSSCQQDTSKRSALGVAEYTTLLVTTEVAVH